MNPANNGPDRCNAHVRDKCSYTARHIRGAMLAAYVLDVGTSKSSPNVIMTMDIQNHQKPCPNPTLPFQPHIKRPARHHHKRVEPLKDTVIATVKEPPSGISGGDGTILAFGNSIISFCINGQQNHMMDAEMEVKVTAPIKACISNYQGPCHIRRTVPSPFPRWKPALAEFPCQISSPQGSITTTRGGN
jgi:hypothetical protein